MTRLRAQERDGRKRLRLFHEADRMAITEQVATISLVYARNVTIPKPWVSGAGSSGIAVVLRRSHAG